jgi:hypothetical protein
MEEEERWALGPAVAAVSRGQDCIVVRLSGVLTAHSYEQLHKRLASERCARRVIEIPDAVIFAVTCKSAVEAALRGTRANQVGIEHVIMISVSTWRLPWAVRHCALMAEEGLLRVVTAMPERTHGRALAASA